MVLLFVSTTTHAERLSPRFATGLAASIWYAKVIVEKTVPETGLSSRVQDRPVARNWRGVTTTIRLPKVHLVLLEKQSVFLKLDHVLPASIVLPDGPIAVCLRMASGHSPHAGHCFYSCVRHIIRQFLGPILLPPVPSIFAHCTLMVPRRISGFMSRLA